MREAHEQESQQKPQSNSPHGELLMIMYRLAPRRKSGARQTSGQNRSGRVSIALSCRQRTIRGEARESQSAVPRFVAGRALFFSALLNGREAQVLGHPGSVAAARIHE